MVRFIPFFVLSEHRIQDGQQAAKQFTEKFETFKDMDAKAICVKKS